MLEAEAEIKVLYIYLLMSMIEAKTELRMLLPLKQGSVPQTEVVGFLQSKAF